MFNQRTNRSKSPQTVTNRSFSLAFSNHHQGIPNSFSQSGRRDGLHPYRPGVHNFRNLSVFSNPDIPVQAKLRINAPGDKYEREADCMAEEIVQAAEHEKQNTFSGNEDKDVGLKISSSEKTPVIQRKCAKCEEEEDVVQAKFKTGKGQAYSGNLHDNLSNSNAGGSTLDKGIKAYMEAGFAHDFSRVKIYTDARANQMAESIGARAFTTGNQIYFNRGEYQPETVKGKKLLAHELTHTIQQSSHAPDIQRKLKVENPNDQLPGSPAKENWEEISDYIGDMSNNFSVSSSGDVTPSAGHCNSPGRTTDQCLCDLHNSSNDWKILIDDSDWPHTEESNHRVTVHSTRSVMEFGSWGGGAQSGQRIMQQHSRVLAHELCGHAWLMEQGTHPNTSVRQVSGRLERTGHDPTVQIENQTAQEMFGPGAPERGLASDPHRGESFAKVTLSQYPSGSVDVSSLPANMQSRLNRVEAEMNGQSLLNADIIGHADHQGSASVNNRVSRQRAVKVRDHLIGAGIQRNRFFEVTGRGSSECPAAAQSNPDCRKVDIFLYIFHGGSERFP